MTDKHNWVKGEVITADLLNSMTTYTDERIDALPVLGTNLLQGTGTASGDVSGGNGVFVQGGFNSYNAVKTNGAYMGRYINLKQALARTNAKAGDWFTISVYVKADTQIDTGILDVYRALGNFDAVTNDGHLDAVSMQNKPITTQWQQYSWSFQINNISLQRETTRIEYNQSTGNNWIYWAGWMLEKGTVAHPWCPAYQDSTTYTDNALTIAKSYSDELVKNIKVSSGAGTVDNAGLISAPAFQSLQSQVNNSAVGTNLIIQSELKSGYLSRDNGNVVVVNADDFHSDNYIPTNGATVFTLSSPDYVFKGNLNHLLQMYDSNKESLGYQAITSPTQTLSKSNVAYIRISINFVGEGGTSGSLSDWLSSHRYKLEKGSVATDWCPNPDEVSLKSYTDTATNTALTTAKSYTDTQMSNVYTKPQVDAAIAAYVSKYLQTKGS